MQHAERVQVLPEHAVAADELVLDYDARQKHRFRATLASGVEVAVTLARGTRLADGDHLRLSDGSFVRVRAAEEALSVVTTADTLLLARVAYHLGNRHVALAIAPGRLAYGHDHVLDEMVRRLGATVSFERGPFVPEGGAYGAGGGHHHAHAEEQHGHGHGDEPHGHAGAHGHHHHDHEHE